MACKAQDGGEADVRQTKDQIDMYMPSLEGII